MRKAIIRGMTVGAILAIITTLVAFPPPRKYIKSFLPKEKLPVFTMPADGDPTKLPFIVKLYDKYTGHFFCSGSVISKNYILTAAHCVFDRDPAEYDIEVRSIDGVPVKIYARAIRAQGQADLAILTGNFSKFNQRYVETNPAYVVGSYKQHHLVACGFPYGGQIYCNEMFYIDPYSFFMSAKGSLYPGMSGGPVVDIETGAIVGVNSAAGPGFVLLAPTIELIAMFELNVQK